VVGGEDGRRGGGGAWAAGAVGHGPREYDRPRPARRKPLAELRGDRPGRPSQRRRRLGRCDYLFSPPDAPPPTSPPDRQTNIFAVEPKAYTQSGGGVGGGAAIGVGALIAVGVLVAGFTGSVDSAGEDMSGFRSATEYANEFRAAAAPAPSSE